MSFILIFVYSSNEQCSCTNNWYKYRLAPTFALCAWTPDSRPTSSLYSPVLLLSCKPTLASCPDNKLNMRLRYKVSSDKCFHFDVLSTLSVSCIVGSFPPPPWLICITHIPVAACWEVNVRSHNQQFLNNIHWNTYVHPYVLRWKYGQLFVIAYLCFVNC